MTSFATAAAASGRGNCRERLRIRRSWLRGSEARPHQSDTAGPGGGYRRSGQGIDVGWVAHCQSPTLALAHAYELTFLSSDAYQSV